MESTSKWREYSAAMEMYDVMRDDIIDDARIAELSETEEFKLNLGIEDMLVNIIQCAHDDEPGSVWIRTEKTESFFRVDIADAGRRFNPLEENTKEPFDNDDDDDFEDVCMGISLARKYFDKIEYKYDDFRGNAANIISLWLKID